MAILEVRDISRNFEGLLAVDRVSFTVEPGTMTCLIGPNGAGKTTVFNLISGLLRSTSGQILFDGKQIDTLPTHQRARRGIGRAFQDPRIFYEMNVLEHVVSGMSLRGEKPLWALLRDPRTTRQWRSAVESARVILKQVGLAGRETDMAQDLSFGEQRFLSIARVLAGDPRLILLDEPTVGLDHESIEQLIGLLSQMVRAQGKTVLLVEHNMDVVMGISDHIHLLVEGRIAASGTPDEVRAHPRMIEAYLGARYVTAST